MFQEYNRYFIRISNTFEMECKEYKYGHIQHILLAFKQGHKNTNISRDTQENDQCLVELARTNLQQNSSK